ncbi:ISAs1 family transposase [Scytonema sp. UIC 10036]|uniref:ISAs1 family transposase n=1 Tax=Scytonema sp. UIC 10036 TaxID=2304196 RepID=UPI001FA96C21|nr:ISAs1 family transposase [Scytonema sp. UIC 10036]
MKIKPKITIAEHFADLSDPRRDRTKRHLLIDIITIAICAVICGASSLGSNRNLWKSQAEMVETVFRVTKWYTLRVRQFPAEGDPPSGLVSPSHDTFARLFSRINPQEFQECFFQWIQSISKTTESEIIAIDGKSLKGSYEKGKDKAAIHMINAWATANRLVLGQRKVDKKSNEIKAIPELIKILDVAGCLVTIDAMGCQKNIVKLITEQQGDYVITLKKNQKNLYKNVEQIFQDAIAKKFDGYSHSSYHTREKSHGREEIRNYLMLSNIAQQIDPNHQWVNLNSIGMVESVRTVDGKTTVETRYYICSLNNDAEKLGRAIRSHWGVENSLHWVLDVAFSEDDCRIRKDNAPENFAVLRRIAINLLGQEKSKKIGIKNKQFLAAMDDNYLSQVLQLVSK